MAEDIMQQWNFNILLQAPVLLTGTVGDETISLSENYISGTTLLGLFATHYLREKGFSAAEEPEFRSWFLNGGLCFLNGYKRTPDNSGVETRALPTPLSYQAAKTEPDQPFDLMFIDDKTPMKPLDGFIVKNGQNIVRAEIGKAIALHHARSNQLYGPGSDEGLIFNYEYLKPSQIFGSAVVGSAGAMKAFKSWIEEENKDTRRIYRIGRSKNTEYGLVTLDWLGEPDKVVEASTVFDFADNIISLTFLSHVILLNDFGQSESDEQNLVNYLKRALKAKKLPVEKNELTISRRFIRTAEIENYVSIWKARRPAQRAYRMGSCFSLEFDKNWLEANRDALIDLFNEMQQNGIGTRRQEGFGRLVFNWQTRDAISDMTKLARGKAKSEDRLRPEILRSIDRPEELTAEKIAEEMPDGVKAILRDALQHKLLEEIRSAAHLCAADFADAENGKNLQGKGSQLNRLLRLADACSDENDLICRYLDKLKKPAKDSLSKIRSKENKAPLLLFLTDLNNEGKSKIKVKIEICLHKICSPEVLSLLGNPLQDEDKSFANTAYKEYLNTLFTVLHKRAK